MPNWEQLEPLLRELAAQLGTTSADLWRVLVQRQIVAGWQDLMWAIFWLATYIIPFLLGRAMEAYDRAMKAKCDAQPSGLILLPDGSYGKWNGTDVRVFAKVLYFGGVFLGGIPMLISLQEAIYHLASPEYAALLELLKAVR